MAERADAPDVVFVPGFMQRGEAWRPVADRLGTRYRSAFVDLETTAFDDLVDELCRRAPDRAALAGYSMGGRIVLHAALRDPGRFAAICVVGTTAGIEDERQREERLGRDEELADWIERHAIEEVVDRWEENPALATQPPALVAAQRDGRLAQEPRRLAALLRGAGQGAVAPVWDRLATIERPLLAVAGEEDPAYVAAARRMATLVPGGEAAIVPGVGHAAHLEAPDAVAVRLTEFLDDHLGDRGLVHIDAEPRPARDGE